MPISSTPPPTGSWGETWRMLVAMVVGVVGLYISVGVDVYDAQGRLVPDPAWLLPVDLSLGVLAFVLLTQRRRWPLAVALALVVCSVFSGLGTGAACVAFVSLATRRRWPEIVTVGVVWVGAGYLYGYTPGTRSALESDPWWTLLAVGVPLYAVLVWIGFAVSDRRRRTASTTVHGRTVREALGDAVAKVTTPLPLYTPPPLTHWGKTWRMLFAVLTGLLSAISSLSGPVDDAPDALLTPAWLLPVDLTLGVVALVLMTRRRNAPLATALTIATMTAVSGSSSGALAVVAVSLATRRRWSELLPVAGVWIVATYVYQLLIGARGADLGWNLVGSTVFGFAVCLTVGFYIGGRRETLANLQVRAETAEREQVARAEQARTAERSRIAREMHDVLAHRISLVALHSGALVYRDDLDREQTVEAATIIRDNAHLALTELREVLGVLRDPSAVAAPTDRPQPTLAALPELVEETRAAGHKVLCTVEPSIVDALDALPDTTSRNAFRILQEALTNARKHAVGAPVRIDIGGTRGLRVEMTVRNPVPERPPGAMVLPSSGVGLEGLAERAKLAGGELEHGLDLGGQFTVRAWLPWPTSPT